MIQSMTGFGKAMTNGGQTNLLFSGHVLNQLELLFEKFVGDAFRYRSRPILCSKNIDGSLAVIIPGREEKPGSEMALFKNSK